MNKEHKLWEKASIMDLTKSEKQAVWKNITTYYTDKIAKLEMPVWKRIVYDEVKDPISYNIGYDKGYEQGKKDERERQNPRLDNMYKQAKQVGFSQARKQTLEEVLKEIECKIDKYPVTDEEDWANDILNDIKKKLERNLKEASK
jgi:hypothetical protein